MENLSLQSLSANVYQSSGPQARPWVRLWARMIDYWLFAPLIGLVGGVVLGFIYKHATNRNGIVGFIVEIIHKPATKIEEILFGIVFGFVYIFLEAILLSTLGTTPGKALLRIRVRRYDGTKLTFSEGLYRAFQVWLKGIGAGIPIVAPFTQINSYIILRREGKTSWDRDGHFTYSHQIIAPFRVIMAVLLSIGSSILGRL